MNSRKTDFILEIGSGHNPRFRSHVLCDRFIDDDAERGGGIVADRPIVEADAQYLPFADGSFDYVICAHVLEHAEDPERMLRELMRVARRGYIETPSEIAERLYGWPFHRSVVNQVGGKLVIRRKDFVPPFGELFHLLAARDPLFRRFHQTHNALLLVQHEWEGRIDYEILPEGAAAPDLVSREAAEALLAEISRAPLRRTWGSLLKGLVPRRLVVLGKTFLRPARPRLGKSLREIVVCPSCKGAVSWEPNRIRCESCRADYPVLRGIPRLVPIAPSK